MVGGTPEFPGQLIASLLVAQWSERWCTSLVAHGSIPGMSRSKSAITRGKTQMMLLPRAAEYGERWEHRSQEIFGENNPAKKFQCKNRSVRKLRASTGNKTH
jgi:hypothetical protein